jgi:hypothetical protein
LIPGYAYSNVDFQPQEFRCKFRQLLVAFCEAPFEILALDVTQSAHPLQETNVEGHALGNAKEAVTPDFSGLLRAPGEWPRDCGASNHFDKIAPSHAAIPGASELHLVQDLNPSTL